MAAVASDLDSEAQGEEEPAETLDEHADQEMASLEAETLDPEFFDTELLDAEFSDDESLESGFLMSDSLEPVVLEHECTWD